MVGPGIFNRKGRKEGAKSAKGKKDYEKFLEISTMVGMKDNIVAHQIIGAAIEVHKALGPGLLESAYEMALDRELKLHNFFVQRQVVLPLVYKDVSCEAGYRLDLLVDQRVIVEIKSVEALNNVHIAQVLTYLKLTECKIGLLINFNVSRLKTGIKRLVNNL